MRPDPDIFSIDHARMLAQAIILINRKRLEQYERAGKDIPQGYTSMEMQRIGEEWTAEVFQACHEMMAHMNAVVADFRRIALDVRNAMPSVPIIIRPAEPKR